MKRLLAFFVWAVVACSGVAAQAQIQSQPQNRTVVEERFNACMNNNNCSIRVRLQIIQEENDEMKNRFQRIHQVCADDNFQDCIDKQKEDVDAWYAAQNNMQRLMQSMQTQSMQEMTPAAGDSSASDDKKKSFWRKVWPFGENG